MSVNVMADGPNFSRFHWEIWIYYSIVILSYAYPVSLGPRLPPTTPSIWSSEAPKLTLLDPQVLALLHLEYVPFDIWYII